MRNHEYEEKLTPEQKEHAIQHAKQERERKINIGCVIIYIIAVVSVVLEIISLVLGTGGILSLILQIVFSIALVSGRNWARVLFIIGYAISVVWLAFSLTNSIAYMLPTWVTVYSIIMMVYGVAACIMLFVSKSVNEYMYWAKNG